jgi:hypothetical protein
MAERGGELKVGDFVRHKNRPEWGSGEVLSIASGKARIRFEHHGLAEIAIRPGFLDVIDLGGSAVAGVNRGSIARARVGWAYALSDASNWGSLEGLSASINGETRIKEDVSSFHNVIYPVGETPRKGDGFAFYFATRSSTPPGIYVVGILNDFTLSIDKRSIDYIDVSLDIEANHRLRLEGKALDRRHHDDLFSGMIDRGFEGGLYLIRPDKWSYIVKHIEKKMDVCSP